MTAMSAAGTRVSQTRRRGRRATRPRGSRTAFVLSGGASLGALQVGMLRALYEHGITADLLVGTSIGALNAAFVASRPQTPATAMELARAWRGIDRNDAFPLSLRTIVGGVAGQRDHLVPPRGLRQIVQRQVQLEDLADARVPLHLIAYDITAGGETVLSDGPALDAIVAACSIPGVFPPVPIGDKLLIDAGVVNNTPISHAVELGAERVFVLPTSDPSLPRPHSPRRALDAAIHAVSLVVGSRLEADIVRYGQEVDLVVLPATNTRNVQPTDFDHSSRLTSEALTATRDMLASEVPERRPLRAA